MIFLCDTMETYANSSEPSQEVPANANAKKLNETWPQQIRSTLKKKKKKKQQKFSSTMYELKKPENVKCPCWAKSKRRLCFQDLSHIGLRQYDWD